MFRGGEGAWRKRGMNERRGHEPSPSCCRRSLSPSSSCSWSSPSPRQRRKRPSPCRCRLRWRGWGRDQGLGLSPRAGRGRPSLLLPALLPPARLEPGQGWVQYPRGNVACRLHESAPGLEQSQQCQLQPPPCLLLPPPTRRKTRACWAARAAGDQWAAAGEKSKSHRLARRQMEAKALL